MKSRILTILKFLIGWPLSIVALVFLGKLFIGKSSILLDNVAHVNWFLLVLSILFFCVYFFLRSLLWQKLLKEKGYILPLKETVYLWSLSEFHRYIPGNIWSFLSRAHMFSKKSIKKEITANAIVTEALLVLIGSLFVSLFSLDFIIFHVFPSHFSHIAFWTVGASVIVLILLLIFAKQITQKFISSIPFVKYLLFFTSSPLKIAQFLLLAAIIFFFFGAGTYTAVISLFFLPPQHSLLFVGFASFSFLAGYLSVVTPMGLGVREGFLTIGLAKFMSLTFAGFASVFSRIISIVAEILFLLFTIIWYKTKENAFPKVRVYIQKYKYELVLCLLIAAYITYFATASFLRYTNFYTGRFDLGNMDQTVWNTLHGKIFQLTDPNGTNIISRLSFHADFILILLAPFYLLWQDPRMLLLLQTVVLALGAFFVYAFSRDIIKSKSLSLILSLVYLLNPSIQYTNLYDFHAVTFATTAFLGAYYFLRRNSYWWTIFFLLIAALTKEEAWAVVGIFGISIAFFKKKWVLGSALIAMGFGMFYFLIWKAIPAVRGGQHFALSYYSDFGSTPTGVVKNILFSPLKVISILLSQERPYYILQLLLPLGFLPLVAPWILLFTSPDLAINLLANNHQFHQIYYQYTSVITPFLFLSAIYGIGILTKKMSFIKERFLVYALLICALVSAYYFGPLPGARNPNIDMFIKPQPYKDVITNFLNDIPSSFSVAATNNLGSHLSHRQKIFTVPVGINQADIIAFLLNDPFAQPSLKAQKQMAEEMKHNKNYIEVFRENDFVVFEKSNLYTHKEPNISKSKLYPASIEALQHRDFEGGNIAVTKTIKTTKNYKSVLFSYPSDGLTIYARADIPTSTSSAQTFPVVIVNRGFIPASSFQQDTAYNNISQMFAEHGFLAIMPDYRNNGQSDKEKVLMPILAYPIDVLNLLSSLPTLPQANPNEVFLWGHSVGGQVTLSTLAAFDRNRTMNTDHILAASIWAPVIDPYLGYFRFSEIFGYAKAPYHSVEKSFGNFSKNPLLWESISPLFYVEDITTPLHIVHGVSDTILPYQWSIELYNDLKTYHNNATLSLYTNVDHNFTNTWRTIELGDITYFRSFLK